MQKKFFPTTKGFWLIHIGCWSVVFIFLILGNVITGKGILIQSLGAALYVGFGIFGGLLFRYLFYNWAWHQKPILRLVSTTLLYVFIEGVIAGLLVTVYVLFVREYFPHWVGPLPEHVTEGQFLFFVFIGNALNMAIFQALWSAIYIALVNYRKSAKRETDALRLENSLKEAQLNTLSNQLNPHFLFNALNNIRFMMRKDAANAETMLTHLSDLLRYALESSKSEKVTIAKELEIVGHYISLAQIQFNERLNFSQQIEVQPQDYLMPPMMLQMLVENAVKHGMDQLKHGGELQLKVFVESDSLRIVVSNTLLGGRTGHEKTGLGIGLSNIKKRLELLYGAAGKIATKIEGKDFVVTLTLPNEQPRMK